MDLLLGIAATLAVAGAAAFEGMYRRRDRGTIRLVPSKRTPWQEVDTDGTSRRFVARVPFTSFSRRYEQTLVDVRAHARVLTKSHVTPRGLSATVTVRDLSGEARSDGYWAASLLGPGESCEAELCVEIAAEAPVLANLHAAVVSIEYATYGRADLTPFRDEIILPLSAVKPRPAPIMGASALIHCVPTHLLTDLDDMAAVIDAYTADFRQSGDIVAVAESVVAITQRQYFSPDEVRPGYFARRLCYFVPSKGSLSSPHGYQLAMNQVGACRLIASFVIGALGKAVGKKGLFYALAGKPAELIDDLTGTMPPYDKFIVAGPENPEAVVAAIKARTGLEAAIVDANDLKRVMVLAATAGAPPAEVARLLIDNPFGNAAEQTPIVVLRPLASSHEGRNQRDQACSV